MRWLLVLLLINGLTPALSEAVEAVAHVATEGHLPHTASDPCDDERGPEHGCGTTWHTCGCCASQVVTPALAGLSLDAGPAAAEGFTAAIVLVPADEASRPFRPPIA